MTGTAANTFGARDSFFYVYCIIFLAQYVWVRTVNRSGVTASWVYTGLDLNTFTGYGPGTLSVQNSNATQLSGVQTGSAGASSIRQVLAEYVSEEVVTLIGGYAYESFNVSLTNRGFTTKPDFLLGIINNSPGLDYMACYDKGSASSSSTNAVILVFRRDGTNTSAGAIGISLIAKQYT
jgi:hypothetical protein